MWAENNTRISVYDKQARLAFPSQSRVNKTTVRPALFPSLSEGGLTIIKILLIVALIAAVSCIIAAIVCLVAASREIELPDIEDIEIAE